MATVIDYAWSGPSPQQIKAAGHQGVMRYISHDGGKDLSPAERDGLRALNLTIGLVFESTAGRAGQGFGAGQADAAYANAHATILGYPASCTLWYAVDFDATASQVQPYFSGIESIAGRTFAPYGGRKVIDGVRYPGWGWQTVAWSLGVSPRAGLLQYAFGNQYDTNRLLAVNYGQWGAASPPPPERTKMDYIVGATDRPGSLLLTGGEVFGLVDQDSAQAFVKAGAKILTVTGAQWDHFRAVAK